MVLPREARPDSKVALFSITTFPCFIFFLALSDYSQFSLVVVGIFFKVSMMTHDGAKTAPHMSFL
jgi:ABC-type nitrate/sulfonate/bicarbonate transport system permease component